jgi:hypothetical protein
MQFFSWKFIDLVNIRKKDAFLVQGYMNSKRTV